MRGDGEEVERGREKVGGEGEEEDNEKNIPYDNYM